MYDHVNDCHACANGCPRDGIAMPPFQLFLKMVGRMYFLNLGVKVLMGIFSTKIEESKCSDCGQLVTSREAGPLTK